LLEFTFRANFEFLINAKVLNWKWP